MGAAQNASKVIGQMSRRVALAEKQARDLARDRDQWRQRALEAEAALKSLGQEHSK